MKEVVLRGGTGPQRVTMQLSVGGVHFGEVDMDVVIKSRAGSLGPAGGLSRASSLGGFGASAAMLAAAGGGMAGPPMPTSIGVGGSKGGEAEVAEEEG